jgi:hypothetical protein
MLIDVIVGAAVLLCGLFLYFWLRSPTLRARIERPKHVFLEQALRHDRDARPQDRTTTPTGSPQS